MFRRNEKSTVLTKIFDLRLTVPFKRESQHTVLNAGRLLMKNLRNNIKISFCWNTFKINFTLYSSLFESIFLLIVQWFSKLFAVLKYRKFHLISWCGSFVEMHNFRRILVVSPETLRNQFLQNFHTRKIGEIYGILRHVDCASALLKETHWK